MTIAEQLTRAKEDYDQVYEAGKSDEYNAFWDGFQNYGNRKEYIGAFRNAWNDNIFRPKYNISVRNMEYIFYNTGIQHLKTILQETNIFIDFSKARSFTSMFSSSSLIEIPEIDASNATSLTTCFYDCRYLVSIDKLIVNEDISYASTFQESPELQTIIFEGTIGQDLDIHWSEKLTHESLMSIINCLKDYSSDTSTTHTLTIGETNQAKLTAAELEIATAKGWTVA